MNSDETREPDSVDESVSDETGADDADDTRTATGETDTAEVGEPVGEAADDSKETVVLDKKPAVESGHRHWAVSLALAVAVAALVGSIVCLGYFGYTGIRAYAVDAPHEKVRNEVVSSAEQAVLNISTIDDKGVEVWQDRMKSSLTGDALKQAIDETSGSTMDQIEQAIANKWTIKATVDRSAVTELNFDEETATVFVLSQAASSEAPDQPQPQSWLLSMVKADGAWKATKVVPLTEISYYDDTAEAQGTEQEGGN